MTDIHPEIADPESPADEGESQGLACVLCFNANDPSGAGGLSGGPLKARSLEVLKVLRAVIAEGQIIISVGGIETADEARERLAAGATLVQGYTGFIFDGPFWARKINRGI